MPKFLSVPKVTTALRFWLQLKLWIQSVSMFSCTLDSSKSLRTFQNIFLGNGEWNTVRDDMQQLYAGAWRIAWVPGAMTSQCHEASCHHCPRFSLEDRAWSQQHSALEENVTFSLGTGLWAPHSGFCGGCEPSQQQELVVPCPQEEPRGEWVECGAVICVFPSQCSVRGMCLSGCAQIRPLAICK